MLHTQAKHVISIASSQVACITDKLGVAQTPPLRDALELYTLPEQNFDDTAEETGSKAGHKPPI